MKTIGIGEAWTCCNSPSVGARTRGDDYADFALRQIGQLAGQALIPTIREAVLDSDVAAFGIANVIKATAD
jgi:hypothetical protein